MHVNDASVESRNTPAIIRETENSGNTLEWLEWWPGGPTGIRICSKGKYSCEWHMRECICREQRAAGTSVYWRFQGFSRWKILNLLPFLKKIFTKRPFENNLLT